MSRPSIILLAAITTLAVSISSADARRARGVTIQPPQTCPPTARDDCIVGFGNDLTGQRIGVSAVMPKIVKRQTYTYDYGRIVANPTGCPKTRFCGCGVSVKIFGRPVRDLFLAANWSRFPRAPAAPGMVAWRPGHVMVIEQVHGDGTATVYDPNSGNHQTRVWRRSLSGYRIVNPRASAEARNPASRDERAAEAIVTPVPEKVVQRVPHAVAAVSPSTEFDHPSKSHRIIDDPMQWRPRPLTIVVKYQPHSETLSPRDEIISAAWLFGVDEAMMLSFARIESDFDCRQRTGSYKGLFQLSDYEFKKHWDGSIYNCRDNARAAAKMFALQAEQFKKAIGHYPDYAERYMVHQQGIDGAIEHYAQPERTAWRSMCATVDGAEKGDKWCRKAIWGNMLPEWKSRLGNVENVTSGKFVDLWTARVMALSQKTVIVSQAKLPTRPMHRHKHRKVRLAAR